MAHHLTLEKLNNVIFRMGNNMEQFLFLEQKNKPLQAKKCLECPENIEFFIIVDHFQYFYTIFKI